MNKSKSRIVAEKIMKICYGIGVPLMFLSASGLTEAGTGNYIVLAISFALVGMAIFIDKF